MSSEALLHDGKPEMHEEDLINPPFLKADDPATFILVGSTGSTKSALGNFLLDPSESHLYEQPSFKVGMTGASETKGIHVRDLGRGVRVVDTAGLNESHEKDWDNMIACVRGLRDLGNFKAVVLTMKFENRMDQTWQDTVKYYKELMGQAFVQNLIVVLNAYKPGSRKYKAAGDPRDKNIEIAKKRVQEMLKLSSPPMVFAVDSYLEEDAYRADHLKTRCDILRFANGQRPISLEGLLVPKTTQIANEDTQQAMHLQGQVAELSEQLKSAEAIPARVKDQVAEHVQQQEQLSKGIDAKRAEIRSMDTTDLVGLLGQRISIHVSKGRGKISVPFNIETESPIKDSNIYRI